MKCPFCENENSSVIDKRDLADSIRRRRECLKCQRRYTSYERCETGTFFIIKKDGRREPFSREKLLNSMMNASWKRSVPRENLEKEVSRIERSLIMNGKKETRSKDIGEIVMRRLKKIDKVAYIRFASIYRDFADISSFEQELKQLLGKE